ncbi:DUF3781 domain-containing protein [Oscillibacter sp. 1-3]|uniref:DUF3781 domain-containing protein n=1 Tax=Oscillibacter sp. 1-3 TaxID=1235797 RepID=UPI001FA7B21C
METDCVVQWIKQRIPDKDPQFEKIEKNWYITAGHCRTAVNAHSYTIITVHKVRE